MRGSKDEVFSSEMLNECMTIHQIRPPGSPMDATDSGIGHSPRGSHPGTSHDLYPSKYCMSPSDFALGRWQVP
jgi:hypothetical protein